MLSRLRVARKDEAWPGLQAVIFDVGGTLFSYAPVAWLHREEFPRVLARLVPRKQPDVDRVSLAIQNGMRKAFKEYSDRKYYLQRQLMSRGCEHALATLGVAEHDYFAISRFWVNWVVRRERETVKGRPDLYSSLEELGSLGFTLGVASNSDEEDLQLQIDELSIRSLIDFTLSSERAGACKPDPGFFRMALKMAECSASQAVYVGDTIRFDARGAFESGMVPILLRDSLFSGGDDWLKDDEKFECHQVSTLSEICELLR